MAASIILLLSCGSGGGPGGRHNKGGHGSKHDVGGHDARRQDSGGGGWCDAGELSDGAMPKEGKCRAGRRPCLLWTGC